MPDLNPDLTDDEAQAIASLKRLAQRWPQSLILLSMDGSLAVAHATDYHDSMPYPGHIRQQCVLADIDGIPNDGGGW